MQLDADEDGEPFFKPPTVASAPLRPSDEEHEGEEQHRTPQKNTRHSKDEDESEQGATADTAAE